MNKNLRKILSAFLLISLLVGLTACGEKTETPDTPDPVGETAFVGGWPYETAPTGHFNMFVPNAITLKFWREVHQLPLATYRQAQNEYEPMLATDWQLSDDNKTFNVVLRDDAEWNLGGNFSAKDVETTFLIYRLVGDPVWNYIDEVTVVSDSEVSFGIKEETTMLFHYVLRKPMVDYETYGEFSDKVKELLADGKDEDSAEWEEVANDFINFRPEKVNATGPYYLDVANISQSNIELPKNEKSFLADKVNFDKIVVYNGDVADLTPLVLNKEVDYLTHQFPAASLDSFIAAGYDTIQLPGVDGLAIYINGAVEPLGQKEVRQALAYVVDRDLVGEFALPGVTRGTKYLSGLGDVMTEDWVDTDKLIDYDVDYDKAEELLTGAGLSKKDGKWYLADGKQFTLSIQAPTTWSDAATAASEIESQLTNFGINTTFDGIDPNSRQANIDDGNFDLALSFFGTGIPHPAFGFETPLIVSNANVTKGLSYDMVQETTLAGKVDLKELINLGTQGWDEDVQRERIESIVYTVNETVPYIPVYTKWSLNLSSEGLRTDWGSDDELYQNSAGDDNFAVIKILNGDLKPISK